MRFFHERAEVWMRANGRWLGAWIVAGLAACGGGQRGHQPASTAPEEVSLEAATVHPSDDEASEAPPSGTPMEQAVRRALDARHAAIAQCYATALRQAPDAVGRISVDVAFTPDGHVDRVSGHIEGEGGIGTARPCVESALRAAVVSATSANGLRVHRSYSFVNPSVDITLAAPIVVSPPAHGHHGAAASEAPASNGPPEAANGPLTDGEVSAILATHRNEFEACYGTVLHATHNATGAATLVIAIAGSGEVTNTVYESAVPPIASANPCVSSAVRAIHFRASGTAANVHASLDFQR